MKLDVFTSAITQQQPKEFYQDWARASVEGSGEQIYVTLNSKP